MLREIMSKPVVFDVPLWYRQSFVISAVRHLIVAHCRAAL